MSNRAAIQTIAFHQIRGQEISGPGIDRGYCIYDNYGKYYDDTWEDVPEDDIQILKKVIEDEYNQEVDGILERVWDNQEGIFINGNWHEWSEIKNIIDREC